MPNYDPLTWTDEVPGVTPLRFRLRDGSNNILYDNVSIELVTSVTPGTPLNAANLNHIEQGIAKARCDILKLGGVSLTNDNGWYRLNWASEDIDDWSGHSIVTDTSKITIVETGVYLFMGDFYYTLSHTPTLYFMQNAAVTWDGEAWVLTGTKIIPNIYMPAGGGVTETNSRPFYSQPFLLAAGTIFEIWSSNTTYGSPTRFSIIRLR